MNDIGHVETDKILLKLENKIDNIYSVVKSELEKELKQSMDWNTIMQIQDKKKRLLETKKKRRLHKLIHEMSLVIKNKNEMALKLLDGELIDVFTLNYNWAAYYLEHITGFNLNFTLYNREAIKELLLDNTPVFTKMAYKGAKDLSEIQRDLSRELTKSILKGESIIEIAKRIDKVTDKNNNGAIRIAQTECTRIESSGRQKAFEYGEKQGLNLNKKWISTLDKRTRRSHAMLMGEEVKLGDKFTNGLEYPGDPNGKASEVIRCRCTHIVEFIGIKKGAKELELDNKLKKMSFTEWEDLHD